MNLYKEFKGLFPDPPLQVGEVTAVLSGGECLVTLPGGGIIKAIGQGQIGQKVYIRDGRIEGQAPNLPIEVIEI